MNRWTHGLFVPLLIAAVLSCSRSQTPDTQTSTQSSTTTTQRVTVSRIDLGSGLTSDRRVITTEGAFAPHDTVYAAVVLAPPSPAADVTARWTAPDGAVVSETTQTVTPSDAEAVTQFQVVKPEGLAPGTYKLEIVVDGQVVSTKEFTVSGT